MPETLEADATLQSEESGLIALRVFKGDRTIVHIIAKDARKLFEISDKIEYWKWVSASQIILIG